MDTLDPTFVPPALMLPHSAWPRGAWLVGIGVAALAVGVLVYLCDRTGSRALLLPDVTSLAGHPLFGASGQWLPSFVHPLAFSLFTAAALKPGVAARVSACAFWSAVNVAFEFGQHPALHSAWSAAMQGGGRDDAITRAFLNYFLRGTFDPFDVLAAVVAAPAAYAILHFIDHPPGARHARH